MWAMERSSAGTPELTTLGPHLGNHSGNGEKGEESNLFCSLLNKLYCQDACPITQGSTYEGLPVLC